MHLPARWARSSTPYGTVRTHRVPCPEGPLGDRGCRRCRAAGGRWSAGRRGSSWVGGERLGRGIGRRQAWKGRRRGERCGQVWDVHVTIRTCESGGKRSCGVRWVSAAAAQSTFRSSKARSNRQRHAHSILLLSPPGCLPFTPCSRPYPSLPTQTTRGSYTSGLTEDGCRWMCGVWGPWEQPHANASPSGCLQPTL